MDRREARLLGHCRRCCNGINFASFGFSTEHLAQHGVRRRLMWRVAGCVRGCSASLLSLYTDLYEKARQEVWEQTCSSEIPGVLNWSPIERASLLDSPFLVYLFPLVCVKQIVAICPVACNYNSCNTRVHSRERERER